jgi:hypothetical protein
MINTCDTASFKRSNTSRLQVTRDVTEQTSDLALRAQ